MAKKPEFNRVPNSDVAKNYDFLSLAPPKFLQYSQNSDMAKNTEFNRFRNQMWQKNIEVKSFRTQMLLKTHNLTGPELRCG